MVKSCSAYGCTNRANKNAKLKKIKFFKFPKGVHKRRAWIKALNRKDFIPNANSRVCSDHFLSGWHSDDRDEVDYSPTIFSYKEQPKHDKKREERSLRRETTKAQQEIKQVQARREKEMPLLSLKVHSTYCRTAQSTDETDDMDINNNNLAFEDNSVKESATQCEEDPVQSENDKLRMKVSCLEKEVKRLQWSVEKIRDNDKSTKFYTGLPTFSLFLWLFSFVRPKAERMVFWDGSSTPQKDRKRPLRTSLPLIDQLFAVLARMKLGLFVNDIADRFSICCSTFSNMFITWICLLHKELKIINYFPSREHIRANTPSAFKAFPNVRVILDCTEIYVQRSSSLINQNLTFSNYKHHNTLKFLIGITPSGVISFVSEAWGGRVSDRKIVMESGILDMLNAGDNVMADKGFTIGDLLKERKCTLNIPPFKGKKDQFTVQEVFDTQEIAKVRIHVERSIGRVKNFHLFDGVLPLNLTPIASKCFQVACWLTNLDVPMVEEK